MEVSSLSRKIIYYLLVVQNVNSYSGIWLGNKTRFRHFDMFYFVQLQKASKTPLKIQKLQ